MAVDSAPSLSFAAPSRISLLSSLLPSLLSASSKALLAAVAAATMCLAPLPASAAPSAGASNALMADSVVGAFESLHGPVDVRASLDSFTLQLQDGSSAQDALADVEQVAGAAEVLVTAQAERTLFVRLSSPAATPAGLLDTVEAVRQRASVRWAAAGLVTPDGRPLGLTDGLLVSARSEEAAESARVALESLGATITDAMPHGWGFRAALPAPDRRSLFQMAAVAKAMPGVVDAHPDFVRIKEERLILNDPLISQQWYLSQVQTPTAWDTTTGSGSVVIAVIDDGYDMAHPDLIASNKVAPGQYDFRGNDTNPQAGSGDSHGTAVAGIAVAIGGNAQGIAGVCPNCRWIPIRQGNSDFNDVQAFARVRDFNAHAVNNSWGYYFPSSTVTNAIADCVINGRGGLGTVVLFASGNDGVNIDTNQDISAAPGALAVGAVTQSGSLASYSNFGDSQDVVAPADNQVTTDLTNGGYSFGPYTGTFGGTSGACPVAAGVIGLIFSVQPGLTQAEAATILFSSTDKIGFGYGADGTSPVYGHGRVNAAKAVTLALGSTPPSTGPDPGPDPDSGGCAGACGAQSPDGCYCDSGCVSYGDCCANACDTCGINCGGGPAPEPEPEPEPEPVGDCTGACGGQSSVGCYCDAGCVNYGDCCDDVCDTCGTGCTEADEPAPSPPAQPEPALPETDCPELLACISACQNNTCANVCLSSFTDAGNAAAIEMITCLSNEGCYDQSLNQAFVACGDAQCLDLIETCFGPDASAADLIEISDPEFAAGFGLAPEANADPESESVDQQEFDSASFPTADPLGGPGPVGLAASASSDETTAETIPYGPAAASEGGCNQSGPSNSSQPPVWFWAAVLLLGALRRR